MKHNGERGSEVRSPMKYNAAIVPLDNVPMRESRRCGVIHDARERAEKKV